MRPKRSAKPIKHNKTETEDEEEEEEKVPYKKPTVRKPAVIIDPGMTFIDAPGNLIL